MKKSILTGIVFIILCGVPPAFLYAESHVSVPIDDPIYRILEMAEIRGILMPMHSAKPYTRAQIIEAIDTISSRGDMLTEAELRILENFRKKYQRHENGLDRESGTWGFNFPVTPLQIPWQGNVGGGLSLSMAGSAYVQDADAHWGTDSMFSLYTDGDLGSSFSYGFNFIGYITRAVRRTLADDYNTYYEGFGVNKESEGYINRKIKIYDEPYAYIPYTYKKHWDGAVFQLDDISAAGAFKPWPDGLSITPHFLSEMSASLFGDALTVRFARLRREWGGMSEGRSLVFNGTANPFVALETTFKPVYWFTCSSITGALEYAYDDGYYEDLKLSAWPSQKLFSMGIVEYNFRDYIHFDIGSTAVYAKRMEWGYLFPVNDKFLYQDSVGDFDNMALFANIRSQIPKFGRFWFSFFGDEVSPEPSVLKNFFSLDRVMCAFQAGTRIDLPFLSFSSLMIGYTKIEPYTYTHTRVFVPYYNNEYGGRKIPQETSYTNMGTGLGYYLNPNSDELTLRLDTMPTEESTAFFQYQMIRHGAAHGAKAVDGSSFWSELDPDGRNDRSVLKKNFLHDGAYRWQHIFQLGGSYTVPIFRFPVKFFGKVGAVYSYYTDIDGRANDGNAYDFRVIDTVEYPTETSLYVQLGISLYL